MVTTFFADACSSVLEMVECVRNVLKPDGGVWINLGPLLYHGSSPAGSAKLCADELISLIEAMGFEILEKSERTTTYCDDPQAMSRNEYTSLFFVARRIKPEHPEFDDELSTSAWRIPRIQTLAWAIGRCRALTHRSLMSQSVPS